MTVFSEDSFYFRVQLLPHVVPVQVLFESPDHIGRLIRNREYPIAPFDFGGEPQILQQGDQILAVESGESTVQELSVGGNVGNEMLRIGVIGDVASSLSRQVKLFSQLFIFLQQKKNYF